MQNTNNTEQNTTPQTVPYPGRGASLSIRICTNGLSFCVYTPGSQNPFEYKVYDMNHTISLAANLKFALLNEPILKREYQRVNVLVSTTNITTVPVAYFDVEGINDVYTLNFPKSRPQHVTYNVLRRTGVALIFGIDRNVYQLLLDDFPRARFYASASTLIEFFSEKSHGGTDRKMYVYLHEKEITIYAFDQGRMLFVNSYPVGSVADMQYYILNLWQQLSFDQIDDSLFIVGDNDSRQELADKIVYFLKNVSLIDRSDDFKDSLTAGNNMIPYDLQTLLVCGF